MGTAISIDKQINNYLEQLNIKQKKAVLTIVKTFADEYNIWDNSAFVTEMDSRVADIESGKVKGRSWDEVKQKAP